MEREAREEQLLKWLNHYKVLLFFPPEKSREVAKQIIEFADEPRPTALFQNNERINEQYERLKVRIQSVLSRSPKSNKLREVTSLASKALWCCYPHDIPMFDVIMRCGHSKLFAGLDG